MPKPLSRAETGARLDSLRALSDRIAAGEMSAGPTTNGSRGRRGRSIGDRRRHGVGRHSHRPIEI